MICAADLHFRGLIINRAGDEYKTREKMGPRSKLVLLAAPKAVDYYPKIGFTQHHSAWMLDAKDSFPVSEEAKGEAPPAAAD